MKFLHFIVDQFYSKEFIELVQSNFKTEEHLFIIIKQRKKEFYINPEKYLNIKVFTYHGNFLINFFYSNYIKIRKIMKQAEFIFIHYLTEEISRILFRFKGKAKILWIMWGADLYKYIPLRLHDKHTSELLSELENRFKSTLKRFIFFFQYEIRKAVIKKIDYVISPIKGDFKLLKKYFKTKTKWYSKVIYPNPVDFEKIDKEVDPIDEKFNFKKNGGKLLLLGNSGAPTNNHLDIMIRLSEMKEQNFKIICPLSYGSPIYMKKIIIKGKKIFGDRFIPLLEFLKPDIYFHILKQIDLAIMYHNRQQGVGTINILLYMGKPLCMKKTSLFFYLKEKGVSFFPSQDFEKLILNEIEFTEAMSEKNKKFVSQIQSINSVISSIDNLLNILEDRNDS